MKKIFILIVFVCLAIASSSVYAQQAPPPVTGDKDLRDTDIKRRSVDMERVERDAKKTNNTPAGTANKAEDKLAAKYEEIKADYEQIQLSQDTVIKTYQTAGKIDYAQIAESAVEINKSAARLDSNLFSLVAAGTEEKEKEEKKENKTEKANKPAKSVRDLIVDLDNTIGSFVTSPMFQNLRIVDAEMSKKAKIELEKIIELSSLLKAEAKKMVAAGK